MQSSNAVIALVVGAIMCCQIVTGQVMPYGCTHSNGVFSCDYRFSKPISPVDFEPQPQRLIIYNVNGAMDSTGLVEWDLINTTRFDDNYDAELTVICQQGGGELSMNTTAFEHMNFWKSVQITNCDIPDLPSRAFENFGTLNYFGIHGGEISAVVPDALDGLVVTRDARSVSPKGELSIQDVEFPSDTFPAGFLSPQSSLSTLKIHKSGLDTVPSDLISHMVNLTTLSLDNNDFTSLPTGLFDGLTALTTLSGAGVNWACDCHKLWWVTYVSENDMRVTSEMLCATPVGYYGQKTSMYVANECKSGLQCDAGTLPAVNLANVTCLTYLQIAIYSFSIIAFIGLCTLLGCWIHTKRQVNRMGGGAPTPRGLGRRVSGSNRVHGAPPGRAAPPGIKGGWH